MESLLGILRVLPWLAFGLPRASRAVLHVLRGLSLVLSGLPRAFHWWRKSSYDSRGLIQLRILRRGRLPGKILRHPVQLDALPDSLIHVMVQRLPNRKQQRLTRVLLELEPRPCA